MTLLARPTASFEPFPSVHHPRSALAESRASLELARVAAGPATRGDDDVSSAAGSPASQAGNGAARAAIPDVTASGAVVTSVSHSPGAFGPSTTFTPLLRPNLVVRSASPMMFRSSRSEAAGFGVSDMAAPTGFGARDRAFTIIGRNSPAAVDTSEAGSVMSRGLIQRSHAVDTLAPLGDAIGVPVTTMSASSQARWSERATGRSLSRDAQGRAATHESVYVFRKQTQGGAIPDRSTGTIVPSIERMTTPPMIQSEAANIPTTEPPQAPPAEAGGSADSSSQSAGGVDIDELVERVSRRLSRHLAIENERRGGPTWR
jgi:hypothetical protein